MNFVRDRFGTGRMLAPRVSVPISNNELYNIRSDFRLAQRMSGSRSQLIKLNWKTISLCALKREGKGPQDFCSTLFIPTFQFSDRPWLARRSTRSPQESAPGQIANASCGNVTIASVLVVNDHTSPTRIGQTLNNVHRERITTPSRSKIANHDRTDR